MDQADGEESGDSIQIQELELKARVGVPDEERARPQRITISVTIWPQGGFGRVKDDLRNAVNYAAVCREIKEAVAARSDKLIETLAEEIAASLLRKFAVARLRLELRKFVLPETKYVGVTICRSRSEP